MASSIDVPMVMYAGVMSCSIRADTFTGVDVCSGGRMFVAVVVLVGWSVVW